jgi:hypothetical protein
VSISDRDHSTGGGPGDSLGKGPGVDVALVRTGLGPVSEEHGVPESPP